MAQRVRIVGFVAVGLVGCRALLDLPDVGSSEIAQDAALTPDTAIAPPPVPEAAPVEKPCVSLAPLEGEYRYQAIAAGRQGVEGIFQLEPANPKLDKATPFINKTPVDLGGTFPGFVRRRSEGGFTVQFDFNPTHTETYVFTPSTTSALQALSVTETVFGSAVQGTCDPPVDLVKCAMTPGLSWTGLASGTYAGATFTTTLTFEYIDDGEASKIPVGKVFVPSYHVHETRSFKGNVFGGQDNHYWFAKDTGLLVQAMLKAGDYETNVANGIQVTANGNTFEFKGHAEFILTSLEPIPFSDAGRDAATDAKKN